MTTKHHYGPQVRVCGEPFLLSLLARIGSPDTPSESVPALVRSAYQYLVYQLLDDCFPTRIERVTTRMHATEPQGIWEGPRLCQQTPFVVCSVIRAGILPSQICYEVACEVLPGENVRLDFLNMSRVTDDDGQVTGVRMDGSKIGGPVDDAIVVIADPMGATGGTVERAVQTYRDLEGGAPKAVVAAHLMITPEAICRLRESCPELVIYTGRVDRGLSPADVLAEEPGVHADRERGLNDVQYIVPGAGGMGELLTNSWV